jgi:tetratricopeptide (TPR) repeat protein
MNIWSVRHFVFTFLMLMVSAAAADSVAPPDKPATITAADVELARALTDAVDSAESARRALDAWGRIAAARPDDPEPWTELASLHLLTGAAYRSSARDRRVCYEAALRACERAMRTNAEFRHRAGAGATPGMAVEVLGAREMGAMHFWSTSVFYIFKDCLGFFGRIRHAAQMDQAKRMLERMDQVDPTWEDHVSTFSWGIYYLAMPKFRGGDREKARDCFDRAVELAPARTLPRWGRGKYFLPAMNEPAAARKDLQAVAERDLDGLKGSRAWNRHFRADAAARLRQERW